MQRRFGSFVDGHHHVVGGRLLDRMAGGRDADYLALRDFAMQPVRLLKRQREVSELDFQGMVWPKRDQSPYEDQHRPAMASKGDENAQLRARPLKLRRSSMQSRNFPKQTKPLEDRISSFARGIREKASLLPPGKEKDDLLRRARLADRIQSEQLGLFTTEIGRA